MIGRCDVEPLAHVGQSGNLIRRLRLADGAALIAKRVAAGGDFISRGTNDRGREAMLWQSGAIARLPREIDTAIVGVERDGDVSWIFMRDVSHELLPPDRRLSREESRRILTAMAAVYREFRGEQLDGLCSIANRLTFVSPAALAATSAGRDLIPNVIRVGWEVFAEHAPPEVVEAIFRIHADPGPLARRLERDGTTLLHGDLRGANMGLLPDRLVLLDWGLACQGTPGLDFAWYLYVNGWRIDATRGQLVDDFRELTHELEEGETFDLALLGRLAWNAAMLAHELIEPDDAKNARADTELRWWYERAQRALERWSP